MKFEDIPNTVKAAVAVGILAIGGFTYHDQFITEAEAAQASRLQWINDIEQELRALKRAVRLASNPEMIDLIQEDIRELEKKLKCLKESDDDKVQYC